MAHQWKVLLLALAVVLAGCGGGSSSSGSGGYPANVKANYLKSCEANSPAKVCNCTLTYIQKRISLKTFEAADQAIRKGKKAPKWVYDAVHACVKS